MKLYNFSHYTQSLSIISASVKLPLNIHSIQKYLTPSASLSAFNPRQTNQPRTHHRCHHLRSSNAFPPRRRRDALDLLTYPTSLPPPHIYTHHTTSGDPRISHASLLFTRRATAAKE